MRTFDYVTEYRKLLTPEVVGYLTRIHEFRGKQTLYVETKRGELSELPEIANLRSIEASNRIEGIVTTEERVKKLVLGKTIPQNRSEREIAGYRDALAAVNENFAYIHPRPGYILQMHRDLYKYAGRDIGGSYRNLTDGIPEEHRSRTETGFPALIPAGEIPDAMNALCDAYNAAMNDGETDPLLLIPLFALDLLCIRPFSAGNGRMSRLLTLLLLYRSGYTVGKYVSIEKLIADSGETYHDALQQSSRGWHDGENDYAPFVTYFLSILAAACREFTEQAETLTDRSLSKPDRVRETIRGRLGKITKSEIMQLCPDVSQVTVQRALAELLRSGEIIKIGGGRYTAYAWNGDKAPSESEIRI